MKPTDEQLRRLLNSAARARRPCPQEIPFALEARVLARWRKLGAAPADLAPILLPLLRRAAICACVLMLISVAFSYRSIVGIGPDDEELTLANSTIDLTLLP